MNSEKQRIIISNLVSDHDVFAKCNSIVKSEYFEPTLRKAVVFIKNFYDKYKDVPSCELIKAETSVEIEKRQLSKAEINYTEAEIEGFCRFKALEKAILASPELIESENYAELESSIKSAISVGIHRDLGLDFFGDASEWIKKIHSNEILLSTGWPDVDDLLGGGVNRQELLLIIAPSGGGKSMQMANFAMNQLQKNLNVLYISFELAEAVVAKRFASMMTGLSQSDIMATDTDTLVQVINATNENIGKLSIKRFPEAVTSVAHIKAYLKQFELINGYIPDVIVFDYLDIMCPSNNTFSADNVSQKEKAIAEEIRALGHQFDCLCVSASQANRGGVEDFSSIGMASIAGSMGKIFTADNVIAVFQDAKMKAEGEIMFKFIKTRNSSGVGHQILMKWDPIALRTTSFGNSKLEAKIQEVKTKNETGRSLIDLIN